jgi:hypothetical protein
LAEIAATASGAVLEATIFRGSIDHLADVRLSVPVPPPFSPSLAKASNTDSTQTFSSKILFTIKRARSARCVEYISFAKLSRSKTSSLVV